MKYLLSLLGKNAGSLWKFGIIALIIPFFKPIFDKFGYLLGVFYALIDSVFNIATYFGADCGLVGKISNMFFYLVVFFVFSIIYDKVFK